jgi:hypothetical protein
LRSKRTVLSLRYGTAFRRAFGDAAVFSRFVSDVLGEPVQVASVRTELRGRGRVSAPMAVAGLGGDDAARGLRVEVWLLREHDHRHQAERAHATAWSDRIEAGSAGRSGQRVATVVVVVPLAERGKKGEVRARYLRDDALPPWTEAGSGCDRVVFLAPWAEGEVPARVRAWCALIVASDAGVVRADDAGDAMALRVLDAIDRQRAPLWELEAVLDESLWAATLAKAYRRGRDEGYRKGLRKNVLEAMAAKGYRVGAEEHAWVARAQEDEQRVVAEALRGDGGGSA